MDVPNADRDRDGLVTTDELRWYTSRMVPQLAANFPQLVQRQGSTGSRKRPPCGQPRSETSNPGIVASFPLIEISSEAD